MQVEFFKKTIVVLFLCVSLGLSLNMGEEFAFLLLEEITKEIIVEKLEGDISPEIAMVLFGQEACKIKERLIEKFEADRSEEISEIETTIFLYNLWGAEDFPSLAEEVLDERTREGLKILRKLKQEHAKNEERRQEILEEWDKYAKNCEVRIIRL